MGLLNNSLHFFQGGPIGKTSQQKRINRKIQNAFPMQSSATCEMTSAQWLVVSAGMRQWIANWSEGKRGMNRSC